MTYRVPCLVLCAVALAACSGSADQLVAERDAEIGSTTTSTSTTRPTTTTEDSAAQDVAASPYRGDAPIPPDGWIDVSADLSVAHDSEAPELPEEVTSWLVAPSTASALDWSNSWSSDRMWDAFFEVGDSIDELEAAYEGFTGVAAEQTDGGLRFEVPVMLHAGGAWHVAFTMTGDSISSGLVVRVEHRLVPPTPAALTEHTAVASAHGWTEDGPEPSSEGAFCGALWFFLSTERYQDTAPLYRDAELNALDHIEAALGNSDANRDWLGVVADLRETGQLLRVDNPTLTFLSVQEERLTSGCPALVGSDGEIPSTRSEADGSVATVDPPVTVGDLIAILASVPISEPGSTVNRLEAIRGEGLEAFVLDSRDWDALGDPYWVIAIGPAEERWIGEDCFAIEEDHGHVIDGCTPRRL